MIELVAAIVHSDEIRESFNTVTIWKRAGERAPHKPLLGLYPTAAPCAANRAWSNTPAVITAI
jgi:hypothetical protein